MKCRWNRTMLNLCDIVAAILKMAIARNFSMSGIYSGHHNLPTYEMSLKSDNVEFARYCGGHFENGDLIGSYTSPYWRSGISSTSVRNSVFSRVERSGTSGKMLNFSHE
jgi:hypothetical protein